MDRSTAPAATEGAFSRAEAIEIAAALAAGDALDGLVTEAGRMRDLGHGNLVTYSPKVFIPLTKLCRDVCHYCTFARPPLPGRRAYLTLDEVLEIARAGAGAGCREALFTLGDKPELRYRVARAELSAMGYSTTLEYLAVAARAVLNETGLLPHLNPGIMTGEEMAMLREVSPSMGVMVETTSRRLVEKGKAHHGSPDKDPAARLATLEEAGRRKVPFTTGLLVGIGESWEERAETLLAIRDSNRRWGHVQEVIVQNFRAKPDTLMHAHPEPSAEEMVGAIALARLVLGSEMSIQAPPNLAASGQVLARYLEAGINDWGGVSPVTIDHVNPEAPWPEVDRLRAVTESEGFLLAPRLCIYPRFAFDPEWVAKALQPAVLRLADGEGLARFESWHAGDTAPPPSTERGRFAPPGFWSGSPRVRPRPSFEGVLERARACRELDENEITLLLSARGPELEALAAAADELRREVNGEAVTFVINRNINYTN
ncbi:MAG: 7,8-didemethyl-8-hydroxy-5-deazariboflavin synthase CofG, partial [Actinomycetota bacterium]